MDEASPRRPGRPASRRSRAYTWGDGDTVPWASPGGARAARSAPAVTRASAPSSDASHLTRPDHGRAERTVGAHAVRPRADGGDTHRTGPDVRLDSWRL